MKNDINSRNEPALYLFAGLPASFLVGDSTEGAPILAFFARVGKSVLIFKGLKSQNKKTKSLPPTPSHRIRERMGHPLYCPCPQNQKPEPPATFSVPQSSQRRA